MTVSYGDAITRDNSRTADPPREVLISAALLVGGFLVSLAINAVVWGVLSGTGLAYAYTSLFYTLLYLTLAAVVLAVRARTPRRRVFALVALGVPAVTQLLQTLLLVGNDSYLTFSRLAPLLMLLGMAGTLGLVAAWGIARRHGTLWVLGLLPGALILVGSYYAFPHLVQILPVWMWGVLSSLVGFLQPIIAGAICWGIDCLTTKPVAATPGHSSEAGQPPAWTP